MDIFLIVLCFVGGIALVLGLGVFGSVRYMRKHRQPRSLPTGYRLVTAERVASKAKVVVPEYNGVLITNGYEISYYGYKKAARKARRDVFVHHQNNVDN